MPVCGVGAINGPYYAGSRLEYKNQSDNAHRCVAGTPQRVRSTHREVPRTLLEPGDVYQPGFIALS